MGQTEPTRQSDEILPPILGSIVNLPLTNAVLIVDLTTLANTAALPQKVLKGSEHTNPYGQYLTLVCPNAFTIAFAATSAALSSLSATATSTVVQSAAPPAGISGQGPGNAGFFIPSGFTTNGGLNWPGGVPLQVRMPPGDEGIAATGTLSGWAQQSPARFMGLILGSGTATISCYVSSR